jgi:hypothetical protein
MSDTQVNYGEYTYEKDAKVVIKGATFNFINILLNRLNDDEVKTYFKHDMKDGFEDTPTMFATAKGMAIMEALELIHSEHIRNVDNGVASKIEEVNRPKIQIEEPSNA